MVFNDKNEIVVSDVRFEGFKDNSYFIPKPGVRYLLTDLVENLPDGQKLQSITDINNHGDILGFTLDNVNFTSTHFLLKRLDDDEPSCPMTVAQSQFPAAKLNSSNNQMISTPLSIIHNGNKNGRTTVTKGEYYLKLQGLK